jgi:hypothetical protein
MAKKPKTLDKVKFEDFNGRKCRQFTVRRAVKNGEKIYVCCTLGEWGSANFAPNDSRFP